MLPDVKYSDEGRVEICILASLLVLTYKSGDEEIFQTGDLPLVVH